MQFTQSGSSGLKIKTDGGAEIIFLFFNNDVLCVSIDDNEIDARSDVIHELFVMVNGEFINLYKMMIYALSAFNEGRATDAAEQRAADFLSSPEKTGRV